MTITKKFIAALSFALFAPAAALAIGDIGDIVDDIIPRQPVRYACNAPQTMIVGDCRLSTSSYNARSLLSHGQTINYYGPYTIFRPRAEFRCVRGELILVEGSNLNRCR